MNTSDLSEFGKGIDAFIKTYLDKRFESFLKHIDLYLIHRGKFVVGERAINMGKAEMSTSLEKISGHMIQIYRNDSIVTGDAVVTIYKQRTLHVENGDRDYRLTIGDRIMFIVW